MSEGPISGGFLNKKLIEGNSILKISSPPSYVSDISHEQKIYVFFWRFRQIFYGEFGQLLRINLGEHTNKFIVVITVTQQIQEDVG